MKTVPVSLVISIIAIFESAVALAKRALLQEAKNHPEAGDPVQLELDLQPRSNGGN
jgi:hypothetical protein